MGITIHFEGALKDHHDLATVLKRVREAAVINNWPITEIPEEVRSLARVRNEEDWNYVGPTSGLEIQPHENSEPLRLEFDVNGYIQEYIKTQFAPVEVHKAVVEFLNQIKPFFSRLEVVDEGEYWETSNISILENHFRRFFEVVEDEKKKNPLLEGPFRLDNGRIADLLETDSIS